MCSGNLALAAADIRLWAAADSLRLLLLLGTCAKALRLPRLPFDAVPSSASMERFGSVALVLEIFQDRVDIHGRDLYYGLPSYTPLTSIAAQ